jgi:tetratricopeptide (TPR) repeat protein
MVPSFGRNWIAVNGSNERAAMKQSTAKTELPPSVPFQKAVFADSLIFGTWILLFTYPLVKAQPMNGKANVSQGPPSAYSDSASPAAGEADATQTPRPDDSEAIWVTRLKAEEDLDAALAEEIKATRTPELLLFRANTKNTKGIALRHLRRFDEGIKALMEGNDILQQLQKDACGEQPVKSDLCSQIRHMKALTFIFLSNTYRDKADETNAQRYAALAVSTEPPSNRPNRFLPAYIELCVSKQNYLPAVDAILKALNEAITQNNDELFEVYGKLAESIFYEVFKSISWDPKTGKRLSEDARDFVDTHDVGVGRTVKYGMTDADEDHATFVTAFYVATKRRASLQGEERRKGSATKSGDEQNLALPDYIEQQLNAGNFEPVAKYLYVRFIGFKFGRLNELATPNTGEEKITFPVVRRKLEQTPGLLVPQATLNAIEAFNRAFDFLEANGQKSR